LRIAPMILAAITLVPVAARGIELSLTQWDPGTGPIASSLTVQADNNLCCGGNSSTLDPISVPFSDFHLAESGGVVAEAGYLLSASGLVVGPIEHLRAQRSSAVSSGVLFFSIDEGGAYSLRGQYMLTGGRDVELHASIWDLTAGGLLFESRQVSRQTPDQAFALGQAMGDSINVRAGARDRMIEGGHTYRLAYRAAISSTEAGDGNAGATGGITLTVLPEPVSGMTAGIGLIAFLARKRRSRLAETVC
jgi:hypothetical protein